MGIIEWNLVVNVQQMVKEVKENFLIECWMSAFVSDNNELQSSSPARNINATAIQITETIINLRRMLIINAFFKFRDFSIYMVILYLSCDFRNIGFLRHIPSINRREQLIYKVIKNKAIRLYKNR